MNFNVIEKIDKDYNNYVICFFEGDIKLSGQIYEDNKTLIDGVLNKNKFTEGLPCLHLDIAGTSFYSKAEDYYPKGATGKVARALYSYFKEV